MRLTVSLIALCLATPALAEEVTLRADITSATVFQTGAELTRSASATLTVGTHRIYLTMPDLDWVGVPEIVVEGAQPIGRPSPVSDMALEEGALDDEAQAVARAAVERADEAVEEVETRIARSDAGLRAAELQLAYLNAIARGGEDGVDMPDDATELTALLSTLGAEMARVSDDLQMATAVREDLTEELAERRQDLAAAQVALNRLRPFGETVDMIAVDLEVEAAGEVVLTAEYLSGGASWRPNYEMALNSDTGALTLERSISLTVQQPDLWQGVSAVFSTANPNRSRAPQPVHPNPARIQDPSAPQPGPILRSESGLAVMDMAMAEEPMVVVEPAEFVTQGLAVSYVYQSPVDIGESGQVDLPLDTLEFQADLTNLAIPRHDTTAFLMAEFENTSGEPILPGETRFYRDGALIGDGHVALLTVNAEVELPFGPLDHLRLEWRELSLDEGDRGIFVQSNTHERRVRFSVENTSGDAEEVRVLYATPFAEQEDLDVELELSPAPTEQDWDDLRGVAAWEVTLEPGATQEFDMAVSFDWPEGQILNWRP